MESPDNIALNEHFSYKYMATGELEGMMIYIMFRPKRVVESLMMLCIMR
jgi:hypothetical protein